MGFKVLKVAMYPSRPLRCWQKFAQFTQAHGEIQYGSCWLEKTDGFSLHSCHDHIKIHVCGVLKRNGIMLKNTRLQRNEHQSLKAMIIERCEMFIHAFGGRINDYNAAAARNYAASSNEMNTLLSGSKGKIPSVTIVFHFV